MRQFASRSHRGYRHAADPRNLGSCRRIGFASEFGSSHNHHRFMAILLVFRYPNRLPAVA
jgi:hypothetical protein